MKNAALVGWSCLVVVATLTGCGSSSPPKKSNAPATASAACVQLHAASAARSARCLGGALADWQAYAASQDDCTAYDRHIAEGKVEYRPEGFDACVAGYEVPCDRVLDYCFYEILHGLVPDGQHCQDTEVCGTVSACFALSSTGNATGELCGEICVRAGQENEACGLYCGGAVPCVTEIPLCQSPLVCANGVCVKPKAAGDSCGGGDPVACATFLSCSADPADPQSTGTCQAHTAGGSCRSDQDCIGTEFCLQGTCAARRAVGASCADAPTGCVPWTACDAGGVCVAAGRPDFPCAPFPGVPEFMTCAVGTCFDTLCVANATPGQTCGAAACAVGSACDPASGTCVTCPP